MYDNTLYHEGDFLLTAVHRDFKVCKTSQNIPPLVSLPQRPLRLPEGGGFGFCHSRPGSSDMHTHKNESRDMHTCQTEPPDHTDTHWSPVQKCATPSPAVSQLFMHTGQTRSLLSPLPVQKAKHLAANPPRHLASGY